jgi:ribonuclease T1
VPGERGARLQSGGVRRVRRPLVALVALVLALVVGYVVRAAHTDHAAAPLRTVQLGSLPGQAVQVVRLVERGGPYPYPEDGEVFHDYEGLLPAEPDGWYHEYTVPTPGSPDRGTRRIVTGRGGLWYYTGDHYASFVRVDVSG